MARSRRTAVLPAAPTSVRAARRVATEHLLAAGTGPALVESAVLVVSELVTNAVRHAGGSELELLLEADGASASVGVRDASPVSPALVEAYDGGGRGMVVVAALAERWHVEQLPTGKVVWAHLRDG